MPDESSAAQEHAILQDVTAPLATLPDDAVPEVAEVQFPIVLRGYDRLAVDAYVKRTSQLVADLQATRSPEAAVRRGLERVGEEVSGILQRAHDAASQITAQSRSEAEDRLERARQEATRITADAERRLQELDVETDRIWAERHRIVEDAQELARQLLALAHSAVERFPAADDAEATMTDSPRPAGVPLPDEGPEPYEPQMEPGEPEAAGTDPEAGETDPEAATQEPGLGEPPNGLVEESGDPDDPEATRVMPSIPPPEEGELR
jgi:cell division septum initiation protein DivIVA